MAGTVERTLAEWLIVALILFTLIVDALLHRLDKWIENNQLRLSKIISNLYKEIMVLGLVSFGFIMYIFAASPDKNVKMTFEVAHIFIFLFAIFHTIVVVAAILISFGYSRRWKRIEHMTVKDYIEDKKVFQNMHEKREKHKNFVWHNLFWWVPHPSMLLIYWRKHERMAFHDTRFQFIKYKNLDQNFPFARYLRSLKYITFVELVEIHWTHYFFFLVVVLLDINRGPLSWHPNFEPIFLVCTSLLNMVFVVILAVKIRKIYFTVLREPAIYFEEENGKSGEDSMSSENESREINEASNSTTEENEEEDTTNENPSVETTTLGTIINFGFTLNDLLWRRNTVETPNVKTENNTLSNGVHDRVTQRVPSSDQQVRVRSFRSLNAFRKSQTGSRNAARVDSHEDENEQAKKPKSNFEAPRWLVAIVPRLGRVPSPGERLFWFGWHKFYIWCVEAVLFFTTVNVSTTIAILALQAKDTLENNYTAKSANTKQLSSVASNSTIACAEFLAVSSEKSTRTYPNSSLMILALIVGVIALIFVLFHVGAIMKKYIFVMNNAQILPREEIEAAIRDVGYADYEGRGKSDSIRDSTSPNMHSVTVAKSVNDFIEQDNDENDNIALRRQMTKYMESNDTGAVCTSPSATVIDEPT